ncbi:actin filament organization protein app1 [Grosmannia clavigera kw1407]|uniref:Actin filament organization protein app1 n=1 Tax=Grosmannia clavigera (strain kw1407 / UAMH 11150) TaxID=655863 RepID=F0XPH5_GROCL|nr:actin filament organization protein app1 [Grosmannia clavigera kw1407]EFX00096.1 actin filament organization protein app1 [Grosmannia clavigera kw1407]
MATSFAAGADEDVTTASLTRSAQSSSCSSSTSSSAASVSATSPLFARAPTIVAHELQRLTRQRRRFAEFEAGLPEMLSQASEKVRTISGSPGDLGGVDGAGSPGSPLPVTDKDSVWLLDNVAYREADTTTTTPGWRAEYVVAVLAQQLAGPVGGTVAAVQAVAERLGRGGSGPVDEATLQTIRRRMRPFLQAVLPGRQVRARVGDDWPLVLSPSDSDGVSSDVQRLPDSTRAGALVSTTAEVPAGTDGELSMQTLFAEGTGWGVISDIDDTIKRTQTSDPVGILQTTFVDEPEAIAGMPELYRFLAEVTAPAASDGGSAAMTPFFYLSASPYNLYPFLRRFRQQHYPHGALLLRDDSSMSVAGLLRTLTLDTRDYKVQRIAKVHGWLPQKTMLCIGDSTQSDPEAYGEIYRSFPGWVKLILIRKVADIAAVGLAEKNEPARFEKAFHDMPTSAWHVFEDPAECYAHVQRVIGGEIPETEA